MTLKREGWYGAIPDHPQGFREGTLQRCMSPELYAEFITWMRGQTVAVDNGEIVYYVDDVDRFLTRKPVID